MSFHAPDLAILLAEHTLSIFTRFDYANAKYYTNNGAIFLRVGNLNHDTIELDLKEIQHVNPPSGAEGKRTRIAAGDILISITADIGMVAFICEDLGEAYINQHLCLVRQTGEYYSAYLAHYLASPSGGLAQLAKMQRGVTKAGLTLGDIRAVQLLLPEIDEQIEIVRRIETLFACADRLEARYKTAHAQVEQLTATLLAKAFRGELVPQDPNDEPASVLLERIRAARVVAEEDGAKLRRRKTDKPSKAEVIVSERKEVQPSHLSDVLTTRDPLTAEALFSASQLELKIDDSAV